MRCATANTSTVKPVPAMLDHQGFEVLEDWPVLAILAANLAVEPAGLLHLRGPKTDRKPSRYIISITEVHAYFSGITIG